MVLEPGWLKKSLDEARKNVNSWPDWLKNLEAVMSSAPETVEDHAPSEGERRESGQHEAVTHA